MNFEYLLELAKQNEGQAKSKKQTGFSTKLSAPKKLNRPAPKGTAIKAFLAKQEEEKKQKEEEERKKKKDLSTSHAEPQCDEDDYGYESAMSQAIFSKLANDYAAIPEDERLKFVKKEKGSISDIKNRVINSLKKEEEEEMGPRKRKRKRKSDFEGQEFINDGDEYDDCEDLLSSSKEKANENTPKLPVNFNVTNYKSDKYENFKYDKTKHKKKDKHRDKEERHREKEERHREREERHREKESRHKEKEEKEEKSEKHKENKERKFIKPKNKSQAPPPMSFEQLLKMAQTKKLSMGDDLVSLQPEKAVEKNKDKKNESDRPLTAKEKEEQEEERLRKLRRMGKLPPLQSKDEKVNKGKEKISKLEAALTKDKGNQDNNKAFKNGDKLSKMQAPESSSKNDKTKLPEKEVVKEEPKTVDRSKYFAATGSQKPKPRVDNAPQQSSKGVGKMPPPMMKAPKHKEPEPLKSSSKGPSRSRDFPPKPVKQFPPPDVRRKGPPPDIRRGPSSASAYGRRIESDDEEEDDMDDFIDDDELDDSYSSEIAKIFGYDRSKFRDDDDDVDDMEVSYSQMQKEERISAKIGLQEDLEDMRREEEERKRKIIRKKQMGKMRR
ncbi:uncharacterized protein LOC143025379 isoform X2 [Oratosquilla oratoria]|uniref:uncharacterized protein LOC143025379 isoform X2 n=1 Tax=Oratosquilla oratoria TaxID=337810 RepID=UPI003F76CD92